MAPKCFLLECGLFLLAFRLAAQLAPMEPRDSLLLNGDFEQGSEERVPGWTLQVWPESRATPLGGALARVNTRVRSGNRSLRIDTLPLLGKMTTLVFNGAISAEATALRGQRLDLSGWVYVEPDTAVRPFNMVLRAWGPDASGKTSLVGTPFSISVVGRPGCWIQFHASGVVPDTEITSMDLHCSIRPDVVRTLQYVEDLRLERHRAARLEVRLPRPSVWRDQNVLAVDAHLNAAPERHTRLEFQLIGDRNRILAA